METIKDFIITFNQNSRYKDYYLEMESITESEARVFCSEVLKDWAGIYPFENAYEILKHYPKGSMGVIRI